MDMLAALLRLCARHGRLILIAGLVAGVALPDLAAALKPFLPEMVALLLFIAALRVGPRKAAGSLRDMARSSTVIAVTHSPALLNVCDTILVLDEGRVAMAGPAREVLQRLQRTPSNVQPLRSGSPA